MTDTTVLVTEEMEAQDVNNEVTYNDNQALMENFIAGSITIDTVSISNITLLDDPSNKPADEWRFSIIEINEVFALTGPIDVLYPSRMGPKFLFINSTTEIITVKLSTQTGIAVPSGGEKILINNGVDIEEWVQPEHIVDKGVLTTTQTVTFDYNEGRFQKVDFTGAGGQTMTLAFSNLPANDFQAIMEITIVNGVAPTSVVQPGGVSFGSAGAPTLTADSDLLIYRTQNNGTNFAVIYFLGFT